ncbi:hypothetical protein FH972_023683 [Carpinus fangiana]|uniref:Uncharacterized protein n=1 Tax=Carpinus fangiana TaxID=176857 RepID=A0A5N6KVW3_9ROSI|nr:hypothetical protein FH972_023683 [Carpinus fangiana]
MADCFALPCLELYPCAVSFKQVFTPGSASRLSSIMKTSLIPSLSLGATSLTNVGPIFDDFWELGTHRTAAATAVHPASHNINELRGSSDKIVISGVSTSSDFSMPPQPL